MKFDIKFVFHPSNSNLSELTVKNVDFGSYNNVDGIRSFFNNHESFISIRNKIINMDNVDYMEVEESDHE